MKPVPMPPEVVERFRQGWERFRNVRPPEPNAVVLATADGAGRPSSRTVLLKNVSEAGFVFYTNLESRKGRQMEQNPRASLTFYWGPLGEQVQVEGRVVRVGDAEADSYWATRPRRSQIGAWASRQSGSLASRRELRRRYAECMAEHAGADIPRPPHWTGLRIVPDRVEFWRNRPRRLHERVLWELVDGRWASRLLQP